MAKLVDQVREAITPQLQPDEQLRTVGNFRSGPFWAMILLSNLFAFAMKYYYVGVTNKRLILVQLNSWGKPNFKKVSSVPLSDVEVKGLALMVKLPDKQKPTKFDMQFGIEKLSGLNSKDFIAVFKA